MQTTLATPWEQVCADPSLQDLPYKVETNASGQIILSPHTNQHSVLQGKVIDLLRDLMHETGVRAVEFAVDTPEGTKVPDVVWMSEERYQPGHASSPVMPDLCVEVLSGSNLKAEIDEKRRLYFEGGAEEVWIVSEKGEVAFYGPAGRMSESALVPAFPVRVKTE